MTANAQLIETLSHSELFRAYERAFNETTGMPLTLRPVETWKLPLHGKRKENAFCAGMSEQSGTCASCLQMQAQLTQRATDKPATMTCPYGLYETAVPVKLGLQTIGFLQTGQVMHRKPTAASFQRAIAAARNLGVDIDNARARRTFFKTHVASKQKLASASDLLAIFAEHLSMKSNELSMRAANAELPIITKAKQFICDHYAEDLSLRLVAQAMNMSVFYFCKLFRKSAGLRFTEFLSRTRVEKAKNLLLNPNLRVSEIAFETGFQSLTHFNRIFKKVEGLSPSAFRHKLSGAV